MNPVLLAARVVLASIFFLAAGAKLLDRPAARRALKAFGVPASWAAPGTVVLAGTEAAIAAALLFPGTARLAAVAAMVLLILFGGAIALQVARGRRPSCNCFGRLSSGPVGWDTVARNGVLAIPALLLVMWGPGELELIPRESAVAAPPALWLLAISSGGAVAGLLGLCLRLWVQQGRLLLRIERLESAGRGAAAPAHPMGPPIGAPAPSFRLSDLGGGRRSLDDLLEDGLPLVLVFTDTDCAPCESLMPEIAGWQRDLATRLRVAVVARGSAGEIRARTERHGVDAVLLQREFEVGEAYEVRGTPSAVAVSPDGTIARALAAGAGPIRTLVHELAMSAYHREAPSPRPENRVGRALGVSGRMIELADRHE